MATTANYGFTLPTVGGDDAVWGGFLNTNWTDLDADLTTIQTDIDSRILTSGIGSAVQAFDATILVDADIGGSLQAWDAQLDTLAGISAANATAVGNLTGINSGDEPDASITVKGIVEKATVAEGTSPVAEKFPDTVVADGMIDERILPKIAAASAGAIGTYIWGFATTALTFGNTLAGSNIDPSGLRNTSDTDVTEDTGASLSGTWRLMGGNQDGSVGLSVLWLRIS